LPRRSPIPYRRRSRNRAIARIAWMICRRVASDAANGAVCNSRNKVKIKPDNYIAKSCDQLHL
jgi:hypothetical protein